MANTVFFAWQLDTPSEHNKRFIWDALVQATQRVATNWQAVESPRPESDTQGVPGAPNIVETIFGRIRQCSVFVADLSFVASTDKGKKTPNPNVLIELGFAARSIGWDRTVLVMNEAHGSAGDLPFDIQQHRWPITYRITENTQVRDKKFETLTDALTTALNECEKHSLNRASEMVAALDGECFGFISQHEYTHQIAMPYPGLSVGEVLVGINVCSVIRRLMQLGALEISVAPGAVGYRWTYDGRRMIDEVNRMRPGFLYAIRKYRENALGSPNSQKPS